MTNWHDRIIAAYDRGKFTPRDKMDAAEWSTDAIAELIQDRHNPHDLVAHIDGDDVLRNLSMRFAVVVYQDDVSMAHMIYHSAKRYVDKH